MTLLSNSQIMALAHVRSTATSRQQAALVTAIDLLKKAGLSALQYSSALTSIQKKAPIDVSFHPDRPVAGGMTVVDSLLRTGEYKSQFETGISNGGLTAFEGGNRDLWEERLFGGAYQKSGVIAADRPKYGALNLMNYWDGACPRFGSCYFRLKPAVAQRCSYAYGDSSTNPDDIAVLDQLDIVLTKLLADIVHKGVALGSGELSLSSVLQHLADCSFSHSSAVLSSPPGRSLDDCIEVHVHGRLDLAHDVDWLAVDHSFSSTQCGNQLTELSLRYGFPIRWNPRFELATDQVPVDFRGPIMVPLAARIAPDGMLNTAKIGQAVVALRRFPNAWEEWGTFEETLQYLKQIWHVLVAFGHVTYEH